MKLISSLLDYTYPGLSPDVYMQDGTLNLAIRDFVFKLLNSFYESYKLKNPEAWVLDVTNIGSLTTNKYIRQSDFDCHVIVDVDKFIETNMPNASKEEAVEYLDNARKEWDRAKILLPFGEHALELYFESDLNPSNTKHVGRYSLLQNKWVKEPVYFAQDDDFEESRKKTISEAVELANELDNSFGEVKRSIQRIEELTEVAKSWPNNKRKLFYDKIQNKLDIIEDEIEKSIAVKQDLVDTRHKQQDAFSDVEIKFKFLSRFHYFSLLQDLKAIMELTEGEVTVDELPLIEKVISQAGLNKEAIRTQAAWIDPNGKVFPIDTTHGDWVADHWQMLKRKYGLDDIDEFFNDVNLEEGDISNYLVSKGWSRLGDIFGGKGFGIQVPDVYDIPVGVFDFLLNNDMGNEIVFEDDYRNAIIDRSELPEGQKAVNKALSHKRLQSASINKKSGEVWDVNGVDVFKNISKQQIEHILKKSEEGFLRYIIDPLTFDLYIWDAYDLHHVPVMQTLGIPYDKKTYEDYSGSISSKYEIDNLLIFQSEGKGLKQTASMQKFASFMKKANGEPKESENVLLIDFDGTIAKEKVFPDIGEPEKGVKEALEQLKELGYTLTIYSSRANTDEGIDQIKEYMEKYSLPYDDIYSGEKPFFHSIIDNRAIKFDGDWNKIIEEVKNTKKASLHIVAYEKKIFQDPTKQQADALLENSKQHMLRWAIGNDGHLYMWDAWYADHSMARAKLGVDWPLENSGYYGERIYPYTLEKYWRGKKLVHASLSTKYWIDSQGRAYALDSNQTHPSWILDNLDLLKREGIDVEYESTDRISKDMFSKGWARISTDYKGEAQFYIELGTSLNSLPSYVEGFVDRYFDPNEDLPIILDSKSTNQSAYVSDPFPSLQNAVNKALRQRSMPTRVFSKKKLKQN